MRSSVLLAVGLTVALAVAAAALFVLVDGHLGDRGLRDARERLCSETVLLKDFLGAQLDTLPADELQSRATTVARTLGIRITLIASDGIVIADSEGNPRVMDNLASRPEVVAALTEEYGICQRWSPTLGVNALFVAVAIRRDGRHTGWIRSSITNAGLAARTRGTEGIVFSAIAIAAAVSAVAGALFTYLRMTRRGVAADR